MSLKVKVDKTLCLGCGACWIDCPFVFELDKKTAKAKIVKEYCIKDTDKVSIGQIPIEKEEHLKKVLELCPSSAIILEQ